MVVSTPITIDLCLYGKKILSVHNNNNNNNYTKPEYSI